MAAKKRKGSGRRGRKAKRVLIDSNGVIRTVNGKVLRGDTGPRTMFYKRVHGKKD